MPVLYNELRDQRDDLAEVRLRIRQTEADPDPVLRRMLEPEAHVKVGQPPVPKNIPDLTMPPRDLPERRDSRSPEVSRIQVTGLPPGTPDLKPPKRQTVIDETPGKRPIPRWLA